MRVCENMIDGQLNYLTRKIVTLMDILIYLDFNSLFFFSLLIIKTYLQNLHTSVHLEGYLHFL